MDIYLSSLLQMLFLTISSSWIIRKLRKLEIDAKIYDMSSNKGISMLVEPFSFMLAFSWISFPLDTNHLSFLLYSLLFHLEIGVGTGSVLGC